MPLRARLHLGRAAVQTTADRAAADILHLKGDAVDPSLRPASTTGTDIDVLVRPDHLRALHDALLGGGWRVYSTFEGGSPFGHAQTYQHETWGYLDLHRHFPGIGLEPAQAFDRLWTGRTVLHFATVACPVPSVPAQAAILVLNAARAGKRRADDLGPAWIDAEPAFRRQVDAEIAALDARLAFDAAFGRLDLHRGSAQYLLWRVASQGGGRVEEWWGRLRAAPTLAARARIVARAPLVNVQHLEHRLRRRPTRADVLREFFARPLRGLGELRHRIARRIIR